MARQGVELRAGGAGREAAGGEGDVALEDAGETVLHLCAGRADRDGARDIGRAVEILRPGIDEVERAGGEALLGSRRRAVMHDCAVRGGARDRREAEVAEMLPLAAERLELV